MILQVQGAEKNTNIASWSSEKVRIPHDRTKEDIINGHFKDMAEPEVAIAGGKKTTWQS